MNKKFTAIRVTEASLDRFNELKILCRTSSDKLLDALISISDVTKLKDYLNDKAKALLESKRS